jgi:hypothetical protein
MTNYFVIEYKPGMEYIPVQHEGHARLCIIKYNRKGVGCPVFLGRVVISLYADSEVLCPKLRTDGMIFPIRHGRR